MKQDEAEKKKQEAKKRLAKAAAHAAGQKCQVMVAYDDCDQIEKVSESGFSKTNDRLEPVIVTMCAANDSWKAEHDKFMDEFTKKTPESLRGAKQMIEKRAEAKVALDPVTIFNNDVAKELSSVEKTYLQSPWMFAYGPGMKSCGPEFSNLGSVKLTTHGHRRILTMKFKSAIQLWAASVASGTVRTVKNICDCVENADKKAMEPYVADKSLKAAELGPGDCLILPPGYIVVESVLNNVAVQGIRTVMMPSAISEDFALSLDCFMPENWSLIKTNTSQAFLKRLVQTRAKIASTKTEIKNATTPKLAIAMKIEPKKKPIAA